MVKAQKTSIAFALFSIFILAITLQTSQAGDKAGLSALAGVAQQATGISADSIGNLVNINSASPELLGAIPGIGPELGNAIASFRDAHGKFASIQDLLKVDGINASLLEKIKPFLQL